MATPIKMQIQRQTNRSLEIEWQATSVFEQNAAAKDSVIANIGGARSSKSYSITQLFIVRFFSERAKTFLTLRKTMPALRITTYKMAIEMMQAHGLYSKIVHNKSEAYFFYPSLGNRWYFSGLDDPEKIKSAEFNYIHMEEANEFTYDDFRILKLRMSAPTTPKQPNQIFLSLNPSDETGWIKKQLLAEDIKVIKSTYKDNPFLSDEYIKEIEALKETDEAYWTIYGLGDWAVARETIFGPLDFPASWPRDDGMDGIVYGLDFGFNRPSAFLKGAIKDQDIYWTELIYETHLTNPQLIDLANEKMTDYEKKKYTIFADPAEPDRIQEFEDAGFNIQAGNNKVNDGIDVVKRFKHNTQAANANFNKEWPAYKWKVDKRTNMVTDEPVKFQDHFPDAGRYAVKGYVEMNAGDIFIGWSKKDIY